METRKILIVEDEDMLRDLYASILNAKNLGIPCETSSVATAEDALKITTENFFDVVLTDYRLPKKDGISLIKEIRENSGDTQCILISGFLDAGIVRAALDVGISSYLKKPCKLKDIMKAVQEAAAGKRLVYDENSRVAAVLEANVLDTILIDSEYNIKYANQSFQSEYGECIGRKCYEVLGISKGMCPHCKAVVAVEKKSRKTVIRAARSPRGNVCKLEECIEPWYDENRQLLGLIVSFSEIFSTSDSIPSFPARARPILPAHGVGKQSPAVFVLDESGRVIFADKKFARVLEIDHSKILGRNITDFLHTYLSGYLKKENNDFVEFAKSNADQPTQIDFMGEASGRKQTLRCSFRVLKDEESDRERLIVIAQNREETEILSDLIAFEQESAKQLLHGHFDMVITIDNDSSIATINKVCETKFGSKQAEIIGIKIMSLLASDRDKTALRRALQQASALDNVYNLRIDLNVKGKIISTLVNVRGVRDRLDNETGKVLVLRDIGKELKMEATIGRVERMQAVGQLAAGTAHQINNYIHGISSYTEMLAGNLNDCTCSAREESSQYIDNIFTSIARLSGLTKHLMTFARAQETPVISMGDVNHTIQNTLRLVGNRVRSNQISLVVELEENLPHVYFSPIHLEQVIVNIILNAIDAVDSVREKDGKVSISSYQDKHWVCIAIDDNGCGIAPEIRHLIFNTFFTTKAKDIGTGLGLAVAQEVISSLSGTIEVDSIEDRGTTMTIKLPKKGLVNRQ